MAKIIACGNDGGSWSALTPVIIKLKELGHDAQWVTEEESKVAGRVGDAWHVADREDSIQTFLESQRPDLVLSSVTGLRADLPFHLSHVAVELGIPVVKVVDFWGTGQPHEKGFAPTRLCVLDSTTREYEAKMRGMDRSRIIPTGAPQFDALTEVEPVALLQKLEGAFLLFIGASNEERTYEIWAPLRNALLGFSNELSAFSLGVLWHPASKPETYEDRFCSELSGIPAINIVRDGELRTFGSNDEIICSADAVIGSTSTEIVKACCLRRPTISVVPPKGVNFKGILKPREITRMPTTECGATFDGSDDASVDYFVRNMLGVRADSDWHDRLRHMAAMQTDHYQLDGENTNRVVNVVNSLLEK